MTFQIDAFFPFNPTKIQNRKSKFGCGSAALRPQRLCGSKNFPVSADSSFEMEKLT